MRRLLPLLACPLLLAACGSSSSSSSKAATTKRAASAPARTAGGCARVAAPRPRRGQHLSAPTGRLNPARTWLVTVETSCGTFVIRLDPARAPRTDASFAALVRRGFYDGLAFHRVAAGFVVQGGDPLGNGTGGPGYTVVERPPPGIHYTRGIVAMAKGGTEPSGASGSQFFVVTAADATAQAGLTPDYALVGRVVRGLDVVERIGAIPTNPPGDGSPQDPVVMRRVILTAR